MTGSYGKPPVNAATATLVPRRLHWSGWICGRAGGPGRRCRCRRRHDGAAPVRRLGQRSVAALLELERHLQLGPEQLDLAVLELHVLRRDLGDAQVAERLRRALDGGPRRLLPRLAARADELDDFVDAVGGHALLPGFRHRDGRTAAAIWRAGSGHGSISATKLLLLLVAESATQSLMDEEIRQNSRSLGGPPPPG